MNKISKVLVMGGNGYVGNYVLKTMAKLHPEKAFIGMSRRGNQREGDKVVGQLENVCFIKGDALNPDSYKDQLKDVDAIISTLGVLFPSSAYEKSYEAMNRDAAINLAKDLDKWAKEYDEHRQFVMLSSARAPIGNPAYLSCKFEAEKYIMNECSNL